MKNVSSLKSSNTDSPKTPGGISRSLLTPCRRIGLSRHFKKSGASPFQSPLSSKTEIKQEKLETRKRKESLEETSLTPENIDVCGAAAEDKNVQTPTRKLELPRRKKSKTLLVSINNSSNDNGLSQENVSETVGNNTNTNPSKSMDTECTHNNFRKDVPSKGKDSDKTHNTSKEAATLSLNSKSRSKKNITVLNSLTKHSTTDIQKENLANNALTEYKENKQEQSNETSPNNLTKECIVVIQNKIFKKELKETQISPKSKKKIDAHKKEASSSKTKAMISQPVFDSDSDDVPLICLNKVAENKLTLLNTIEEDDTDFAAVKTNLSKPVMTKSKTKLTSSANKTKSNSKVVEVVMHKAPDSQNSDEDDDLFEKKRTIIIKKSYEKVIKPHKAKSTGSITQKDIDDLKARIETKKKMLLARAMTEDTKELRDLIKKWQKGCQDALMELMDLMKLKCPDKQNMDYSEMLQTLRIPSSLVGYDSDNDCFLTPDDESIVLAKV